MGSRNNSQRGKSYSGRQREIRKDMRQKGTNREISLDRPASFPDIPEQTIDLHPETHTVFSTEGQILSIIPELTEGPQANDPTTREVLPISQLRPQERR